MSDKPPHKSRNALATVAEFEVWLSKKKTDHNYEFVRGQIIKKDAMKQNELFIVSNLINLSMSTEAFAKKQANP